METSVPRIPGVDDHASYIRFLDNRKAFDGYHKKLTEQVGLLREAIAVHGKAKEIEKLHADAAALKASVLSEIDKREADLKTDREAHRDKMKADREKFAADMANAEARLTEMRNETAKALNEAKVERNAASEATKAARTAQDETEKSRAIVKDLQAELERRNDAMKAALAAAA